MFVKRHAGTSAEKPGVSAQGMEILISLEGAYSRNICTFSTSPLLHMKIFIQQNILCKHMLSLCTYIKHFNFKLDTVNLWSGRLSSRTNELPSATADSNYTFSKVCNSAFIATFFIFTASVLSQTHILKFEDYDP